MNTLQDLPERFILPPWRKTMIEAASNAGNPI